MIIQKLTDYLYQQDKIGDLSNPISLFSCVYLSNQSVNPLNIINNKNK